MDENWSKIGSVQVVAHREEEEPQGVDEDSRKFGPDETESGGTPP